MVLLLGHLVLKLVEVQKGFVHSLYNQMISCIRVEGEKVTALKFTSLLSYSVLQGSVQFIAIAPSSGAAVLLFFYPLSDILPPYLPKLLGVVLVHL